MAVHKDNMQIYTTLSKDIVKKIDYDAKNNSRTRSKQIAHILKGHYKSDVK